MILLAIYVEEIEKMMPVVVVMMVFMKKQFKVLIVAHVITRVSPATVQQLVIASLVRLFQRSNF
jgi:hypothetical protein